MDAKTDSLIRAVFKAWLKDQPVERHGVRRQAAQKQHVTDEALACLSDGNLPEAQRRRLMAHCLVCRVCALKVSAILKTNNSNFSGAVPEAAMDRARTVISRVCTKKSARLVLEMARDTLVFAAANGLRIPRKIFNLPVPVMRGRKAACACSMVVATKDVGPLRIELAVARASSLQCTLRVCLKGKVPLMGRPKARVTLMEGGSERESYGTTQGVAVFEALGCGRYCVIVSCHSTDTRITLDIVPKR